VKNGPKPSDFSATCVSSNGICFSKKGPPLPGDTTPGETTDFDRPWIFCEFGDIDLSPLLFPTVDMDRPCGDVLFTRDAPAVPPSEADRPLSTIHSAAVKFELKSLLPFLVSSTRVSEVDDDEGDGSATFLNVRVHENSSPEKNAVSVNEGNTLMFDMDCDIGIVYSVGRVNVDPGKQEGEAWGLVNIDLLLSLVAEMINYVVWCSTAVKLSFDLRKFIYLKP